MTIAEIYKIKTQLRQLQEEIDHKRGSISGARDNWISDIADSGRTHLYARERKLDAETDELLDKLKDASNDLESAIDYIASMIDRLEEVDYDERV